MHADQPPALLECNNCGALAVGNGEVQCCDRPMKDTERCDAIPEPALPELLRSVFDMSDTELEICLCVMEGGGLTVQELASKIGYDRSVVSRHLNHLAELRLVDKQRRILKQGGYTYVYQPVPPEQVRERLTTAFVAWSRKATDQLGSLQREKVEAIADTGEEPAWEIFREV